MSLVTTNGRFVHESDETDSKTLCGVYNFYHGPKEQIGISWWDRERDWRVYLHHVTDDQARAMFACKKCVKKGMVIPADAREAVVQAAIALRKAVADRDSRHVYSEEDFYSKIDAVLDAVDNL